MEQPRGHWQGWQTFVGRGVQVHAPGSSYAASVASAYVQEAEPLVATLRQLLAPAGEHAAGTVTIVLVDAAADLPEDLRSRQATLGNDPPPWNPRESTIFRVVRPGSATEPLAWYITRVLVRRWFGRRAVSARLFVEGLAGLIAAHSGAGLSLAKVETALRDELAAGKIVSIMASDDDPNTTAAPGRFAGSTQAATSFVAYLLASAGREALGQLFAEYDPERRDQAVLTAYKRPLGVLEETWLASLRREPGGVSTLRALLGQLGPLLRPYWRQELEILFYMVFELGYGLALPLTSMYVVDTIIPSGNVQHLMLFVLGLLLIYGLDAGVGLRRAYVNEWVNERLLLDLRARLFAHLQQLPQRFYNRARVGDLMTRLFDDLDIVGHALAQIAGVGVYLALRAVVTAVTLVWLSPLLGALVLVVVPLFALAYLFLRRRLESLSYAYQNLQGDAEAATQENLSAQATVKAFGLEARAVGAFRARLLTLLGTSLRLTVLGALFETSMSLAITLGQLIVIGVGAYLVMTGALTVGTLLAFIGLLAALFQPVGMLSNVGQTIQRAAGSLARITELLAEPLTIADGPDAVPLAQVSEAIRLERVSFGYDDRPVLRDLSLDDSAGQHVAIVGPSGAGKSTLLNLLLRFWDPTEGRLLVDGRDLRDLQVASLRGQIGVVLQDPFIFDTTLRENIALGRPDATDAEIVAAARGARLHEYITSLPAGYDTVVGERGVRMSGGQRQRLAIARALLRQPSLLILDEPTSALDAQTEREILDTLAELAQGRTTISITHRLSLAATADRIFVLADGRLVEQGSHAELVRAGGLYRRMYDEQTSHLTRGPGQDELGHHDDGERDGVENLDQGSRTRFVPA